MTTGQDSDSDRHHDRTPTPDHQHLAKRKRVTLSCLICKARKVKCDKLVPCRNCVNRNESHLCTYEEGQTPPPPGSGSDGLAGEIAGLRQRVALLESLHHRVQRLEDRESTAAGSSRSVVQSMAVAKATPSSLEQTFTALDYLCSRALNGNGSSTSLVAALDRFRLPAIPSGPRDIWPSIIIVDAPPRSTRWILSMQENYAVVPDQDTIDILVGIYNEQVSVYWSAVHPEVFRAELAQFHEIRRTGNVGDVDPAWLALLLGTIYLGALITIIEHPSSQDPVAYAQRHELVRSLGQAFESTMHCAGFHQRFSFRLLQASVPLIHAAWIDDQFTSLDGSVGGQHWLNRAHNMCREARLHRVDEDVLESLQDPAFPPGPSLYKREMVSRVVHTLYSSARVRTTVLADIGVSDLGIILDDLTTPDPGNYLNAALWPGVGNLDAQPPRVLVEASMLCHLVKMTRHWARVSHLLRNPELITPETAADFDRDVLRDEQALMSMACPDGKIGTWHEIGRASLRGSYNVRRLRLQRHLSLRSLSDTVAKNRALSAAHDIIEIHRSIASKYGRSIPSWLGVVFYGHDVSAAVTLFIHGCLDATIRLSCADDMRVALSLFEARYIGGAKRHELLLARGTSHISRMLKRINNPPQTLSEIEEFLSDVRDNRPPDQPTGKAVAAPLDGFLSETFFDETTMLGIDWDALLQSF